MFPVYRSIAIIFFFRFPNVIVTLLDLVSPKNLQEFMYL
jgi:hypothetical protein